MGNVTGAWLFVALIESCVGTAMALYGWRQHRSLPLVFGVGIAAVPGVLRTAWLAGLIGAGLLAIFAVVRK